MRIAIGVAVAIVVLVVLAQLLAPGIAARVVREQVEKYGTVKSVTGEGVAGGEAGVEASRRSEGERGAAEDEPRADGGAAEGSQGRDEVSERGKRGSGGLTADGCEV